MERQEIAVVAVLPGESLAAALADYTRPPADGDPAGGPPRPRQALLCRQDLPPATRHAIHAVWPHLRILAGADWAPVAEALAQAGVPDAAQAAYARAWQQGDALLVLSGIPAESWPAVEQALAPHLRAPDGDGTEAPDPTHGMAPPFAVYGLAAPNGGGALSPAVVDTEAQPDRPGPAPAPLLPRYADVRAPRLVPPAELFAVSVALRRQAPAGLESAPALQVQMGPTPITVILYAEAFEIVGPARADLEIVPDQDSDLVTFQLRSRPEVSGAQEISVTFLQGTAILGRVVVTVQVGGQAPVTKTAYQGSSAE